MELGLKKVALEDDVWSSLAWNHLNVTHLSCDKIKTGVLKKDAAGSVEFCAQNVFGGGEGRGRLLDEHHVVHSTQPQSFRI